MREKGIRRYYFFKLLGSYLLILFVILTGAFSVFFYYLITAKTEELDGSAMQSLEMAGSSIDALYEQTTQIGTSLIGNRAVNLFLSAGETTPAFDYEVLTYIKTLQSAYPFIHSILLYQKDTGQILSSLHGYTLREEEMLTAELDTALSDRSDYRVFSIPTLQTNGRKQEEVIGFFYYATFHTGREAAKSVVIVVKRETLEAMLQPSSLLSEHSYCFIDRGGNMILSTQSGWPEHLIPIPKEVTDVAGQSANRYEIEEEQKKWKVFSADTQMLHWRLILLSDADYPLVGLQDILRLLIIFSIVLLFAGITASILFTRHLYSPVRSLLRKTVDIVSSPDKAKGRLNEYDYIENYFSELTEKSNTLQSFVETTTPYLNEILYKKLIENHYSKREEKQIMALAHAGKSNHRILLVSMDIVQHPDVHRHLTNGIEYYAAQNMLHELLSVQGLVISFQDGGNTLVCLLSADHDLPVEGILAVLQKIQTVLWGQLQTTFSAAIGKTAGYLQISESMADARQILEYRFLLGEQSILTRDALRQISTENPKETMEHAAEKIINAFGNEEHFSKASARYFMHLRQMNPAQCLLSLKSVLQEVRQYFIGLYPQLFTGDSEFYILFEAPENLITLERVQDLLMKLNNQIILEQYQKISQRNEQLLESMKHYIREYFSDPDLNVEQIAAHLHFSAGYIRKLFKSLMGIGISEYIVTIRLDEAKRLLITTNLTATVICEKIGLYNNTYFSTLFKKRFGTTPILYRQTMLLNDKEENRHSEVN